MAFTFNVPAFSDEEKYDISVLIPTRGRTIALKNSLVSLVDAMDNPTRNVIMLGFDEDDVQSMAYYEQNIVPYLLEKQVTHVAFKFPRMGYLRLNEYVNTLAMFSDAKWLFFYNDDTVMQTAGWDSKIMEHDGEFKLLAVHTNREHPYSVFPILPKEWYKLIGHVSPHSYSDTWVSEIGYLLDIVEFIDVWVIHDRHDLTGNNGDATYEERNIPKADANNPIDINHISWVQKRYAEVEKLAWYLKTKGCDISFWKNVKAGTQSPWVNLKKNDPNNQVVLIPVGGVK